MRRLELILPLVVLYLVLDDFERRVLIASIKELAEVAEVSEG